MAKRKSGILGGSTLAGVVLALLSTTPALAGCFGPEPSSNHGAGVSLSTHSDSKGVTGRMDLFAVQPEVPCCTTIVHATQLDMTASGDFVGWGTAKGDGTTGGIENCPTYTGTRWQVYIDGISFGLYFCRQQYGSTDPDAQNQVFQVIHTACPTNGVTTWVFYWFSNHKTCQATNASRATPIVMGESIDFDPQEIDVHYELLQYRVLGSGWLNWTAVPASSQCVDTAFGYVKTTTNGSTDWTFRH